MDVLRYQKVYWRTNIVLSIVVTILALILE